MKTVSFGQKDRPMEQNREPSHWPACTWKEYKAEMSQIGVDLFSKRVLRSNCFHMENTKLDFYPKSTTGRLKNPSIKTKSKSLRYKMKL